MQYLLTKEEFEALMPKKEHEEIRNNLLDEISTLENTICFLKAEIEGLIKGNSIKEREL